MTKFSPSSNIDEFAALPIARIEAQDEPYTIPLREYLETNGCTVITNMRTDKPVAYHIVCGDFQFVKHIFSHNIGQGAKRLGIIMGPDAPDGADAFDKHTKIIVTDPVHLPNREVPEIFSFFFTGDGFFLDKRRNIHEAKNAVVTANPAPVHTAGPVAETRQKENTQATNDRERIGNILTDVFGSEEARSRKTKKEQTKKHNRRKRISALQISGLFLVMFVLPFCWYTVSVLLSGASVAQEIRSVQKGKASDASRYESLGTYWLYQSKLSLSVIKIPFTLLGYETSIRGQERLLSLFSDASTVLHETALMMNTQNETIRTLFSPQGNRGTPASSLEKLRLSSDTIEQSLGLIRAQLAMLIRDRTFPLALPRMLGYAREGDAMITSLRGTFASINKMLTLYPQVAGFKDEKTYLLLFQNSSELRPTGGFIGSLGLVKLQDGMLSDIAISDVYTVDGQLKGHVDPPAPIKELLAQEHWYLRDSNWDPDFKISAEKAAWFYEKETGISVDGVIAVNAPVVVDLLAATGPIVLSDFNDRITSENFFGKSIFYTQKDFFPGSTQKSDFLGALSRAIITKITSDTSTNPPALFRAVAAGFARHDIMFWFTDSDIQNLIEYYGWGGRFAPQTACTGTTKENCLTDEVAVSESNMSVSKVNYFISHATTRDITLSGDGSISETITRTIRNTASADEQGVSGIYRAYIRFYLPQDASISDVFVDSVPARSRKPGSTTVPAIPYIEPVVSGAGVRGIAVVVDIPIRESRTIQIVIRRTRPLPLGRGGAVLSVLYAKHPGIMNETLSTVIRYPPQWKAQPGAAQSGLNVVSFIAKEGQLQYNTVLLQDQQHTVTFIQ